MSTDNVDTIKPPIEEEIKEIRDEPEAEQVEEIRNAAHKPKTEIIVESSQTKVLEEIHEVKGLRELLSGIQKATEVWEKTAERKERELKSNQRTLNETKKNQFKKFMQKAMAGPKSVSKPDMIYFIFYENKIYSTKLGFTLTEMAQAAIEVLNLGNSVTLIAMKRRIKAWINGAREKHTINIFPTADPPKSKRFVYHITKQSRDFNSQIDNLQDFEDNIDHAKETRRILKVAEEKKREEEAKAKIVVDSQGHTSTAAEPQQNETDSTENTENEKEEGADNKQ